jgi:hypothetical protein
MNNANKILHFFFVVFSVGIINAQTIELTPLYNSIGIKVTDIGAADSCKVEYKPSQQSIWRSAYPPDRISINSMNQFRGSIFMLDENTPYEVQVTIYTGSSETALLSAQTTTLNSPSFAPTSDVKWVSPSGTGNYTPNNPGNLATLFSSGQVSCGATIIFKDGIYSTNGLQLTLNSNCTENTPIVLIAESGAVPIIDAGTIITATWTPHPSIPDLYSIPTPPGTSHSNICVLGNTTLYPYPSLTANALLGNYNLSSLNFGYDGFVRDENSIWIKTQTGINPNDSIVRVSNAFRFLTVYGNGNNAYLKVKGITFRYFGKPVLNNLGSSSDSYPATVFDLRNVYHVYFDSCRFFFNTNHIFFTGLCNNITIQNSYFKHDAGKWSHAMIKKSNAFVHTIFGTVSSSRARGVETPAIFLQEGKSAVFRNNLFDGLNSGIESYIDIGLKEDVDIYNNSFIDNFDAIECDGLWTNLRVWNNEIIKPMAGVSAAPPLIGPRYFYRNVFHGMQGRRNEQDDLYFIGCSPIDNNYVGQGTGIKTNSDYTGNITPGNIYFFNNTFHAFDTLGFVFTSWQAEWRKAIFINNTYSHTISHPFFYFDLADNATNGDFQITSINENYFSHNNSAPIVKVKHIYGQFTCTDITTAASLQNLLGNLSGSPYISIQNPIQANPLFLSTNAGGFELAGTSPLIDAGAVIQGFYDYHGTKPDIGAKESSVTVGINDGSSHSFDVMAYPNPSSNVINIQLPDSADDVIITVFNFAGQKIYHSPTVSGQLFEIEIGDQPNGIYFIEVYTEYAKVLKKVMKISF